MTICVYLAIAADVFDGRFICAVHESWRDLGLIGSVPDNFIPTLTLPSHNYQRFMSTHVVDNVRRNFFFLSF